MPVKIRLWQRDADIITETKRSPLSTGQIARLLRFTSNKKAAERLLLLHRAGITKRVAYFHPSMQGKPENAHHQGTPPHPRTLPHTLAIAEIRVQLNEWLRCTAGYTAEFSYAHEVHTSCGLLPDATIVVHKDEQTALVFIEIDRGTEPLTTTAGYSLAGKLRTYAQYFDSGDYQHDFSSAVTGFRVAIVVPTGRLRQLQRLVQTEEHDFVLITTAERITEGFHRPIWINHENTLVDVLGRPAETTAGSDNDAQPHSAKAPRSEQ